MFLRKSLSHGKVYLSFVQGYRDKDGRTKQKTVMKLGYLDDLKKKHDNPIEYFKQAAKDKNNENIKELVIRNINVEKAINNSNIHNLGYTFLNQIYKELDLPFFFKEKQKHYKMEYDLNSIFQLLVFNRILFPGSKLEAFNNKDLFFNNFKFSLKDLYRSLDYFQGMQSEIQTLLWNNTKDKYKRDTSSVFYDCTNYYFEISYNDEDLVDEFGNILEKGYRKKGPSKENRKDPIIQMGLLMDNSGIPLSYNLFPGNESEKTTLRPALKKLKNDFNLEKVITVADRGLNTSDNTVFIAGKNDDDHKNHDGYVFGQSVLGADKEFKEYVLDPNGYIIDKIIDDDIEIHFKHKSRVFAKTIQIMRDGVRKNKSTIYQKQMVYYSEKYAQRQKKEREIVISKAQDLINNPGKYTMATSYGASKYINNIDYDKKTGEVIAKDLSLKLDKIQEEEKYDGYYSIVTSELELDDIKLRNIYKGLWRIEESFKITKSHLEARPVYVWTKEHIEAHFLTCFVSLVILRLLEKKISKKYSIDKILYSLRKWNCSNIEHDIYLNINYNEIIDNISNILNINLSNKYLLLKNIKSILK